MCALLSLVPYKALFASSVGWVWSGGITENSAVITARIESEKPARLRILETDTFIDSKLDEPFETGRLHRFELAGLKSDNLYSYTFVNAAGESLDAETRTFRTFPTPGSPTSFRFALGSCANAANSPVFAAAAAQGARFFLHTGDFHYKNIAENRVELFRKAYDLHLSSPNLRTLLMTTPIIYQWDDHDFGPNDSDRNSPSREASRRNFRELVPHYPLALPGPTDQAFSIGRVRFILSDLRSERDKEKRRMMSAEQEEWLKAEFLKARDSGHALIFWVSSVPWNGKPSDADRWQGYSAHRTEIADFIKANNLVGKVAILSGDAHMTAIDDGANTDFASGGGAPIPVFQAGPIANQGSYKGGPYNRGARFRTEAPNKLTHFGLVDITDDGKVLQVKWTGRSGADGIGNVGLLSDRDPEGPVEYEFTVK